MDAGLILKRRKTRWRHRRNFRIARIGAADCGARVAKRQNTGRLREEVKPPTMSPGQSDRRALVQNHDIADSMPSAGYPREEEIAAETIENGRPDKHGCSTRFERMVRHIQERTGSWLCQRMASACCLHRRIGGSDLEKRLHAVDSKDAVPIGSKR